jgi:hypothetical protein
MNRDRNGIFGSQNQGHHKIEDKAPTKAPRKLTCQMCCVKQAREEERRIHQQQTPDEKEEQKVDHNLVKKTIHASTFLPWSSANRVKR